MDPELEQFIRSQIEFGLGERFDPNNTQAINRVALNAEREGIASWFFWYARTEGWNLPPNLAADWSSHIARIVLYRRLTEIVVQTLSFPFLVMKGEPLSWKLFDDAFSRTVTDLDILVSPDKVYDAIELLRGVGFRQVARHSVRPWAYNQVALRHVDHGAILELHWRIALPHLPSPNTNAILGEIEHIKNVPVMGDPHLVIHLAHHLYQHRGFTKGIFDLAALVTKVDTHTLKIARSIARGCGTLTIVDGGLQSLSNLGFYRPAHDVSSRAQRLAAFYQKNSGFLVQPNPPKKGLDFAESVLMSRFLDRADDRIRAGLKPVLFGPHRIGTFFGSRFGREWW